MTRIQSLVILRATTNDNANNILNSAVPPTTSRPVAKCNKCGSEGHWYDNCRLNKPTKPNAHELYTNEIIQFDRISNETDNRTEIMTGVRFIHNNKEAKLRVKVDTGAQGNLLSPSNLPKKKLVLKIAT